MKKVFKKVVLGLAVVAMTIPLALGLSGCGSNNNNGSGNGNGESNTSYLEKMIGSWTLSHPDGSFPITFDISYSDHGIAWEIRQGHLGNGTLWGIDGDGQTYIIEQISDKQINIFIDNNGLPFHIITVNADTIHLQPVILATLNGQPVYSHLGMPLLMVRQ